MILSKSKILILALLLFLLSGFGIVFLLFLRNNDGIGHPVIGKNETHKSGVFINFLNDEVNDFTTTDGLTVSNESEISYNTVSTTIRSPPTILMKTKSEEIEQCQLHIPKFQKGQCNATIEWVTIYFLSQNGRLFLFFLIVKIKVSNRLILMVECLIKCLLIRLLTNLKNFEKKRISKKTVTILIQNSLSRLTN